MNNHHNDDCTTTTNDKYNTTQTQTQTQIITKKLLTTDVNENPKEEENDNKNNNNNNHNEVVGNVDDNSQNFQSILEKNNNRNSSNTTCSSSKRKLNDDSSSSSGGTSSSSSTTTTENNSNKKVLLLNNGTGAATSTNSNNNDDTTSSSSSSSSNDKHPNNNNKNLHSSRKEEEKENKKYCHYYEHVLINGLKEAFIKSKNDMNIEDIIQQSYGTNSIEIFNSSSNKKDGINILSHLLNLSIDKINHDTFDKFHNEIFESSGLKHKLMKLETYNYNKQHRKQLQNLEKERSLQICRNVINGDGSSNSSRNDNYVCSAEDIMRYEKYLLQQDELKKLRQELDELNKHTQILQQSIDKENKIISSVQTQI